MKLTVEHINQSIVKALNGQSGMDLSLMEVRGFSTYTIRNFFHAICNTGKPIVYLEVGLFCGATFCSSFNENTISIGIEDHSQDFSAGFDLVKQELKDNVEKHKSKGKGVDVIYGDCFNIDISLLPKVDIYFFDGFHSEDSQRKALPHFLGKMANRFLWVIDDYSWSYVKEGTDKGIEDLKDKIQIEEKWVLGEGCNNHPIWHNSLAVYLINKK